MFRSFVDTPFGLFAIEGNEDGVIRLYLPNQATQLKAEDAAVEGPLPWDFDRQMNDYLAGKRKDWNLPFTLTGTPFQLAVWYACKEIPYGETRTYGELASMAGYPDCARAVGNAMAVNPLPLVVPCHRVIPTSRDIGEYAGGPELKSALLTLEQQYR